MWNPDEEDELDKYLGQAMPIERPTGCKFEYEFEGIKIIFPYEAYKSQQDMMREIIQGVNKSEHCLLESPTGTGKTAALICSLLAWQNNEDNKIEKAESIESPVVKKMKMNVDGQNDEQVTMSEMKSEENERPHIPVIYYVTRTHSQIKTVVNQFKCTAYSTTPMVILGSRQQTCINEKASQSESVDDTCYKFRQGVTLNEKKGPNEPPEPTCEFYEKPTKLGDTTIRSSQQFSEFPEQRNYEAWDIEDLKAFGVKCDKCPYYGMRVLEIGAKIVFCTYNHLLYPRIRKASNVKLEDNIIVFDEAHNIEDICCNVASDKIKLTVVDYVIRNGLTEARERLNIQMSKVGPLKNLEIAFTRLSHWLSNQTKNNDGFNRIFEESQSKYHKSLSGIVAVETFTEIGFGPDHLRKLWIDYFILEDEHYGTTFDPVAALFKFDRKIMNAISSFLSSLNFLFKKVGGKFINLQDYHILLVKKSKWNFSSPFRSQNNINSPRRFQYSSSPAFSTQESTQGSSQLFADEKWDVELQILCLNPAIAFRKMTVARSIIVTSGTLTPFISFEYELGTKFHRQLSADHVLNASRVYAALISKHKVNSSPLTFTKTSWTEDHETYQRALAEMILDICQLVQYGVLVFVTSKGIMEKLKLSWTTNGYLNRIKQLKDVYIESDTGNANDFQAMLDEFQQKVTQPRGAILFAILRGKISEGVDFKDNQARCVVTIGIPFLPLHDERIEAKQRYNDSKCAQCVQSGVSLTHLSGRQWYSANAFRALNQAFGRCVRHVKDWGSIFIIDNRFFSVSQNVNNLSRWVREALQEKGRVATGSLEVVLPDYVTFLNQFQLTDKTMQ